MGTPITGNIDKALLNNNYVFNKIMWGIRNRSATWRAITGYKEPGVLDPVSKALKFPMVEDVSGFEGAFQFNMALATFDKVPANEDELDVVAGDYIEDVEEFSADMCHYARTHFISDKRKKKNTGNVKTQKLEEVSLATLGRGIVKQLNAELFQDTDASDVSIASLPRIIHDSNKYMGIDRSLSKYADLRAYRNSATGAANFEKIALARTSVVDMGGSSDVAICGPTVYNYAEYLCRQIVQVQVKNDERWAGFGGEIFHYGNTVFALDTDCPAGKMYGISVQSEEGLNHWVVQKNESPMTGKNFIQDNLRRGHPWYMPFDLYLFLGCATPGAQWVLEAITAPSGYSA